ncbi:MAG: CotH kinase family protein [Lachnospiraceae bacterium]|nr:CotH kinase family protein [Lachnospiraceae bacterium]
MKRKVFQVLGITLLLALLTACGESASVQSGADNGNTNVVAKPGNAGKDKEQENSKEEEEGAIAYIEDGKAITFSPEQIVVCNKRFFSEDAVIEFAYPEHTKVFYTTDGSEPNTNAKEYTEPIVLKAAKGSFPNCMVIKAKAYFGDGSQSEIITHTFFAQKNIDTRFETLIFSVSGEPADLTYAQEGIFNGDNAKQRGRESEREIYVEVLNSDGSPVLEQGAGVRPYGGASRGASIKSMKLFARKEYDPNHGKFKIDTFGTVGADGDVMNKYDKLVLRNYGNDFQFAFVRDELNQRLAAQMGYTDVEAVVPAVVYLNGVYYGLHYLHESYCDDFFKDKYGDGEGRYEVLEGNEQHKSVDEDDEENAAAAEEFNATYDKLAYSDLTKDSNYQQFCEFMDVENYLQYYAFNIYINNNDWPQNNYKCYRYYAGADEKYGKGEQDGRWRFLFHDMDYCMGLYGADDTAANYNNLKYILDEEDDRYSPLFANLMKRADCRQYFLDEINAIMTGPMWSVNVERTLDSMNAERQQEMVYFFEHLEAMKKTDDSIWIWYDEYERRTDNIRKFAAQRSGHMKKFLKLAFGTEK